MLSSGILFSTFVFSFMLFSVVGYLILRTTPHIWETHHSVESIGISGSILGNC